MKKILFSLSFVTILTWAASTYTTHYNLEKPSDGDTNWGEAIRDNFDTIDSQLKINENSISNHLADTVDAHDASAISTTFGSAVCITSDTVQEFLDCLDFNFNTLAPGGAMNLGSPQTVTGLKTFATTPIMSALGTGLLHSNSFGVLTSSLLVNADVSASAAISFSKLASLPAGYLLLGDASNVPTATAVSGDITIDSSGVTDISAGVIVNADINSSAAIGLSKLAPTTASRAIVSDGSGVLSASSVTATELGYLSGIGSSAVGVSDTNTLSNKTFSDAITAAEISSPSTPSSGFGKIYFKSDGFLYQLNDSGVETKVGSGASGDINIVQNADVEQGVAVHYSNSGGTLADATSGSNLLFGNRSGTFDASAASQHFETTAQTIPNILTGGNCLASMFYKGGDANLSFQVLDGSNNIIHSQTLVAATNAIPIRLNFICPSSGSLKIRVASTADAALIAFDQLYIGDASNLQQLSQASLYGTLSFSGAANCFWTTSSTSFANFASDPDCNSPTATGNLSTSGGKIPGVVATNLPPGAYVVVVSGAFTKGGVADEDVFFRLSDGTTHGSSTRIYKGTTASHAIPTTLTQQFTYTTAQSSVTWQVQGSTDSASNTAGINLSTLGTASGLSDLLIKVYRFPLASSLAYSADVVNWKVDAEIGGFASLGVVNVSSLTGIEDSSLTLTNNAGVGTISAQIPCSGTNPPTGTTCSAGNESVGVSFNLPVAGDVLACTNFRHYSALTGQLETFFKIVETPNNAQTIIQEGAYQFTSRFTAQNTTDSLRLCETFTFSSAGKKTLRLMYIQGVTPPVTSHIIDYMNWEVYPITQSVPMPVIVGGVTTGSSGSERVERLSVRTTCTSSPCTIASQSGSWATSVTRIGTGNYSVNYPSTTWASAPSCVCFAESVSGTWCQRSDGPPTTTEFKFFISALSGGVLVPADGQFSVICMGPK